MYGRIINYGKDAKGNNKRDEQELGMKNVVVKLYNGNEELCTETKTDENGNYLFEKLKIDKYYVEFEYDGITYETVKALGGENIESYISDPNSDKFTNTSKATEIGRQEFNNKFKVISSGTEENTANAGEITLQYATNDDKYIQTNGEKNIWQINLLTTDENGVVKEDFRIKSSTKELLKTTYPLTDLFRISLRGYDVNDIAEYNGTYYPTYKHMKEINLGLVRRDIADFALSKEVYEAELKINNREARFEYNVAAKIPIQNYNVNIRIGDTEYYYTDEYAETENQNAQRVKPKIYQKIYPEDYNFKIDAYGDAAERLKVKDDDELKAFITYKITLKNESEIARGKILEVADWYDPKITPVNAYALKGETEVPLNLSDETMYGHKSGAATSEEYKCIYINDKNGEMTKLLQPGEKLEIYITFEVNKDGNRDIYLGDIYNVAEITAYSTLDAAGNATGQVDADSIPGNVKFEVNEEGNMEIEPNEDDNECAGMFNISLYNTERILSGYAWDDTVYDGEEIAFNGDEREENGKRGEGEAVIDGIFAELVELKEVEGEDEPEEYVWTKQQLVTGCTTKLDTRTGNLEIVESENENGQYLLKGYIPGDYIIRFSYGANKNVLDLTTGGENGIKYNGQDYQTTVFDNSREKIDIYSKELLSDAKDVAKRRQEVINYSTEIGYTKGEILDRTGRIETDEFIENTKMDAETPGIHVDVLEANLEDRNVKTYKDENDKRRVIVEYVKPNTNEEGQTEPIYEKKDGDKTLYEFKIENIDLGLKERPRSRLELEKQVKSIKITSSSGIVLIDTAENITKNLNNWQPTGDAPISAYLDKEIMQGATIQVTYELQVKNNSDVDYFKNYELDGGAVNTSAMELYDYVANNFVFRKEDNNGLWEIVTTNNNMDIAESIKSNVSNSKTILVRATASNPLLREMTAGNSTEKVKLVLSKVISPESTTDNLTYKNEAEIVKRGNGVGRRDYDSIPGNHPPYTEENIEPDTGIASIVIVLPPFGETHISNIYYILGAIAAITIGGGIILIKKFVLK